MTTASAIQALLITALVALTLLTLLLLRLLLLLPHGRAPPPAKRSKPARLAVFWGSGGHTAEMATLLKAVDFARYTERIYVYGRGDGMSVRVLGDIEREKGGKGGRFEVLALPRARAVGEGKLSTIISASKTLSFALWYCFLLPLLKRPGDPWADVLLLNGPGTGVVLVLVAYIRRVSRARLNCT